MWNSAAKFVQQLLHIVTRICLRVVGIPSDDTRHRIRNNDEAHRRFYLQCIHEEWMRRRIVDDDYDKEV